MYVKSQFIDIYMINLIDQNSIFNSNLTELPPASATISIFGSQNSGKSTFFNHAFETHFPILDTAQNRKRCTKGIWVQHVKGLNLIDTQGFDSAQRVTEERILERQFAFFCVAISDIIFVNLWMNEVGRYKGSQMHIFKAIMNTCSSLPKNQHKTIIFVVKDCIPDVKKGLIKSTISEAMNKLLKSNEEKSLKFDIDFVFLSHYVKKYAAYVDQVKGIRKKINVRKPMLKEYSLKDRVLFMKNLWKKIQSNDNIDLRNEEEALKHMIIERIRKQTVSQILSQMKQEEDTPKRISFLRFYSFYIKRSFAILKKQLPKYTNSEVFQTQCYLLEEDLVQEVESYFNRVVLPREERFILDKILIKEIKQSLNSIQLQKIIKKQRKESLVEFKRILTEHRQKNILMKEFQKKVNEESLQFQRQVGHIFSQFQAKLEKQVNEQVDQQLKNMKFNGKNMEKKIKSVCQMYQYNQWELRLNETWLKVVQKILNEKIFKLIEKQQTKFNFNFWEEEKQIEIIRQQKILKRELEEFCESMLVFFEQEQFINQFSLRIKEKISNSIKKLLQKQRKRFKFSLLLLAMFFFFFYGEFLLILNFLSLKKKTKTYLELLFKVFSVALVCGALLKKYLNHNHNLWEV